MALTVNGVPLNTLAKNIETLSGRLATAPRRGGNRTVSGRNGTIKTRKRFGENTIILPMWVQGCNDDGTVPTGSGAVEFWSNLDQLTGLFSQEELLLVDTLPDGSSRQIRGQVHDTIDFAMSGQGLAKFSVAIVCPDPFWEDTQVNTQRITGSGTAALTRFQGSTAPIEDAVITFTGPCNNPSIESSVTKLNYSTSLLSGQSVTVDCGTWKLTGAGGHTPDYADLKSVGDARLFVIPPPASHLSQAVVTTAQTGLNNNTRTTTIVARRKFMVG